MILHGIALIGLVLLLVYLLDCTKKHEPWRAMIIFFSPLPVVLPLFRWHQRQYEKAGISKDEVVFYHQQQPLTQLAMRGMVIVVAERLWNMFTSFFK